MAALFEAYITNLGKYNEGELVGETLKFPTSPQAVEALLKNIGVDGIRYEEFFITSFDGDVLGLYDYLGEYENLDCFEFYSDIESEDDLGRCYAEDLPIPAELKDYIDYEASRPGTLWDKMSRSPLKGPPQSRMTLWGEEAQGSGRSFRRRRKRR